MANPLTAPLVGFAAKLRFPTLFKITLVLMVLAWIWPFEPDPFIDEIVTALAALVLANWRRKDAPATGEVIEGQARRE